jgi:AraC family transcriptional regulator
MTFRFEIDYPHKRSTFETLFSSGLHSDQSLWVNHVRTSPGFNTSLLPRHVIGLHLGKSVVIAHAREKSKHVHYFRPGDTVFTPMGDPVHYAHPEPVDALYIDILPAALEQTAEQIGIDPTTITFVDKYGANDSLLFRIGSDLLTELRSQEAGSQLYFETLSTQIMLHLLRHYTAAPDRLRRTDFADEQLLHERFRPVVEYVQTHFSDDISLKTLADLVYLTPAHFSRLFKRAFGLSPYQYVLQKRVDAARHLLNDPALTVADVALRVGFADHSHLSRHYKRLIGSAPRA